NKAHLKTYSELLAGIDNPTDTVPATLKKLQQTIMRLDCLRTIESDIKSFISKHHGPDAADWPAIWQSIKLVWASKWNERAFISRRSRGIPHELLHIAVLIQQVVSAEYSFVIHTVNPFDLNRDEIYAEIVPGLGETLVGNYPGRAMSFACSKSLPNPKILMYPSKSFGLHGSGLIFRSDSNGEDLPGYAGAGLYDSIMPTEPQTFCIDYSGDRLCVDPIFQHEMMSKITEIGTIIENQLNGPQDIEGCFREGRYFVVQARPQVGL
ncbi:MAG: hypothetical protein GY868_13540, partial [Deltaproteobacteria bacterium]|nr:hypothetical protein [Deltaproteobacteria bacterium]